MVLVLGIVKTVHEYWYWYWVLLRTHQKLVLVLGIVKASLEILGIGIGVKKVVLLMSAVVFPLKLLTGLDIFSSGNLTII